MIDVSRRRRFEEGLQLLQRAVDLRPLDPGLWYSLGWCSEFAAQATRRSPTGDADAAGALYRRAADAFRRCLALHPGGKLAEDAADLLEIVEDQLGEA